MTIQSFQPDPVKVSDSIEVTPAAAAHFQKQIEKVGKNAIRLSLKESGCTGFKYVLEEVAESAPDDIVKLLPNGVKLFIDSHSISPLQGLQIDIQQQGLNRSLVMNNPNVKDACGCGESFSF